MCRFLHKSCSSVRKRILKMAEIFKYKSPDVALLLMSRASEKKIVMNHTKVQKFMFILYTLYLTTQGQRLTDESPKAWPYGPVFPIARTKLKKWGVDLESFSIDDYIDRLSDKGIMSDETLREMCDGVLSSGFGSMTTNQLVSWTHTPGAPWDTTTKKTGFKWNDAISDELIKSYYGKRN